MNNYIISENAPKRSNKLHLYNILDTHTEAIFADLTRMISKLLNLPIVLISLVDKDGQWFKSEVGIDVNDIPNKVSFCRYTVIQDQIFEVENTHYDAQFQENPLITGNAKIAFYAGAPLTNNVELHSGKLFANDTSPRKLSEFEGSILKIVSKTIIRLIEFRKKQEEQVIYHTHQTVSVSSHFRRFTKTSYPKNLFSTTP